MLLTWLGQSGVKILTGKMGNGRLVIYIDPVFPHGTNESADLLIVTHAHPDHYNRETIERLRRDDTVVMGTREVVAELHDAQTLVEGTAITVKGIPLAAVPAYTTRTPPPHGLKQPGLASVAHPRGDAIGIVLRIENKNIYHCGDTDIVPEMQDIKTDVLLVPIGAHTTMDAKAAARATELIKPLIAIPIHYGTNSGTFDDAELYKELVETTQQTTVLILTEGKEIEL